MKDTTDNQDRVLTLERTFDAPKQLVWEAWTQAEHIAAWWGPTGMETEVEELDFRPGGRWKYLMKAPNGSAFPTEGVFTEIIEYEKIVCTGEFGMVTNGVILDIRFAAIGAQTKMTFAVIHPTAEYRKQQEDMGFEKGWGSTFARLAAHLTAVQ